MPRYAQCTHVYTPTTISVFFYVSFLRNHAIFPSLPVPLPAGVNVLGLRTLFTHLI